MKKLILAILLIISGLNIMAQCPVISSAWDTHTNSGTTFAPYAIATDDLGNVFIAGHFNSTATFNNGVPSISPTGGGSLFVVKYDKFGNTQWAINAGANSSNDQVLGITVKPDGSEIFVTGKFSSTVNFGTNSLTATTNNGSTTTDDIFVAKLIDTGGNRTWAWAIKAGGKGTDASVSIARDNAGKIYVGGTLGYFSGDGANNEAVVFGTLPIINCVQNEDSFVARLTDNGTSATWDWVKTSNVNVACAISNDNVDILNGIAVNKTNGDVFITGYYYQPISALISFGSTQFPSTYGYDAYFAKLDTDGNWQWATKAGGPCCANGNFGDQNGKSIAVDSVGNVFVMGDFTNTMSFGINSNEITQLTTTGTSSLRDVFIGKINANGTWAWAKKMGGNTQDYGGGIKYHNGQIWGIGSFTGTATFKTTNQLTSAGSEDIFLVNLDKNGNWIGDGATKAGGSGLDGFYAGTWVGQRIAFDVDVNNVPVAAGRYNNPAIFGSTTLSKPNEDSFVFRANCGETTPTSACNATMSAFNPCNTGNDKFRVMAMTKDAAGNTYLAGKVITVFSVINTGGNIQFVYPEDGTAVVIKYNTNNQAVYVVQGGGENAIINDITLVNGVPVVTGDYSGIATFNIFTTGTNTTLEIVTSAGANDIFVAEIQTRNLPLFGSITAWGWTKYAGGLANDHASAISSNNYDQIVITGNIGLTTSPTNFGSFSIPFTLGSNNMYVAKISYGFNFFGNRISINWSYVSTPVQPSSPVTASNEYGVDIVANAAGEAFVIGHYAYSDFLNPSQAPAFGSTVLLPAKAIDIFVAKLNVNGTWAWATKAGNNTGFGSQSRGHSIALGDNNDVYIGASFILESGDFQKFGNTAISQIPALSNTQLFDVLVGKINGSGQWQWAKMASGSGNDIGGGVAYKNGKVHLTGYFEGTENFGGINITSAGLRDYYFARLTSLGQWLPAYTQRGGGAGQEIAYLKAGVNTTYSLEVDADENDYTVGYHGSPATFGLSTLTPSTTNLNAVVIKAFCSSCATTPIALTNPNNNIPSFNPEQKTLSNINATNFVTGGNVLYQAGTFTQLDPGFQVTPAVTLFRVQMGGCN
jgi:glutamine cyclotransferase